MTSEFLGVPGPDAMYFITYSIGIKSYFHGVKQPNLKNRTFRVIFPIRGLQTPCDFIVDSVLFTNKLSGSLSEHACRGKTLLKPPWSTLTAFAIVNLQASHFFDALIKGERIVQGAIDWIQLRTDITIPCIRDVSNKVHYNLRKNFSRFYLIKYGIAIDMENGAALYYLLDERVGHDLVFNYDPSEYLEPIAPLWDKLTRLYSGKDDEVRALYQTLNWLMLSYEEEKPTDNLLQLWIAFEFLCSKERVPEIVKRENIEIAIDTLKKINIPENEKKELL